MGKKDMTSTSTSMPDPKTQAWQEIMRQVQAAGLGALGFSGYGLGQAAGGITAPGLPNSADLQNRIRLEGEYQKQQAGNQADATATLSHAFGGDRSGLYRATAEGEINRNTQNTLANLGFNQQNEQWNRILQLLSQSYGPSGMTSTQTQPGSWLGGALGLGESLAGLYKKATSGV
jgi:hypothetical protein